jgi:acetyl-CoA carboxylase carboxyltransferase component
VNGDAFDDERARCAVLSYDYTVLAGTQGLRTTGRRTGSSSWPHSGACRSCSSPKGGGGRPGDTDGAGVAGSTAGRSTTGDGSPGLVPLVGVNSGRCFAGNAALLGCCDVVIATAIRRSAWAGPR